MQNKSLNDWQPGTGTMGSGYVMPYTVGGPAVAPAQADVSLQPETAFLPGSPVSGNTDAGVSHS